MINFEKVLRIATTKTSGGHIYSIYVHVKYSAGRLSFTGVEGALPSGNCLGGWGQIDGSLFEQLARHQLIPVIPWTLEGISRLLELWERWHLNDVRAGCEHQREWDNRHVGLPCPVCGYKYGTAWLKEEVTQEVIDEIQAMPDADKLLPSAWL